MKLASAMGLLIGLMVSASFVQAKDRYLVVFKSQQGQKAMESYFNTESGAIAANMQKSLKNVRSMVLKTKDQTFINRLKTHPEVAVVEAEYFTPVPKPANGFTLARVNYKISEVVPGLDAAPVEQTPIFKSGDATPWGIIAVHAGEAWAGSQAGANARVMVLDTGIDAEHPVIKANFEKGKNFTADDNGDVDAANYADGEGHGTHCSGTILGAYNDASGFTGVAPKAKLLMGRVCGTQGCSSVAIVEGIEWAITEKVDVISMSLGGPFNSQAQAQAVANAETAGVVVVAASGNSATEPTYNYDKNSVGCKNSSIFNPVMCGVSYPAALPTVIAVGALDSKLVRSNFSQWGPELDVTAPGSAVISSVPRGTGRESSVELTIAGVAKKVKSSAFSGTEMFAAPLTNSIVVVPGVGKPEDFAQVNVEGKFALVKRGEIYFSAKVANAVAAKAAGVILYNNADGLMQGAVSEGALVQIPVVMIEQVEALALLEAMKLPQAITATVATTASDYAAFDGTSMATPHVAGVVALIRSANKNLTPAQVRQILISTTSALAPNDTNQFGSGIVQADKAVAAALAQP
ncbi:MAG: S8 family serine peptidase [Bdellovibrio sp.]|nr:S8 family serine peptidase [Bdellovibrio sp.]